ncbi:MAG: hypothetical protein R2753_08790 [Chitinophagales bacterium]
MCKYVGINYQRLDVVKREMDASITAVRSSIYATTIMATEIMKAISITKITVINPKTILLSSIL